MAKHKREAFKNHGDFENYMNSLFSSTDTYFPPSGFYFAVEIDGFSGVQGSFQEVSGIDVEVDLTPIKEAGENTFSYKVPGRTKYNNLTLKRGLFTPGSAMFTWVQESIQTRTANSISPKPITVRLLDPGSPGQTPLVSWNFKNAYPVKWSMGKLNSQDSAIVIETVEFAYTEWSFVV